VPLSTFLDNAWSPPQTPRVTKRPTLPALLMTVSGGAMVAAAVLATDAAARALSGIGAFCGFLAAADYWRKGRRAR
jgi:hypothetical protein